jgi:hypothetical protein
VGSFATASFGAGASIRARREPAVREAADLGETADLGDAALDAALTRGLPVLGASAAGGAFAGAGSASFLLFKTTLDGREPALAFLGLRASERGRVAFTSFGR